MRANTQKQTHKETQHSTTHTHHGYNCTCNTSTDPEDFGRAVRVLGEASQVPSLPQNGPAQFGSVVPRLLGLARFLHGRSGALTFPPAENAKQVEHAELLYVLIQYSFIAKCQNNFTRNVLWRQVHSSHIHSNHKTLNYNNSK